MQLCDHICGRVRWFGGDVRQDGWHSPYSACPSQCAMSRGQTSTHYILTPHLNMGPTHLYCMQCSWYAPGHARREIWDYRMASVIRTLQAGRPAAAGNGGTTSSTANGTNSSSTSPAAGLCEIANPGVTRRCVAAVAMPSAHNNAGALGAQVLLCWTHARSTFRVQPAAVG